MTPADLLAETSAYLPGATPAELFRMCMLLCHASSLAAMEDPQHLADTIGDLELQLSMHEDQHAGVAMELDSLASTEPCQFHVNQLWTLIRAIKVQSQLLNLYLGPTQEPAVN